MRGNKTQGRARGGGSPRFCMKLKRSSRNSFLLGSPSSSYSCTMRGENGSRLCRQPPHLSLHPGNPPAARQSPCGAGGSSLRSLGSARKLCGAPRHRRAPSVELWGPNISAARGGRAPSLRHPAEPPGCQKPSCWEQGEPRCSSAFTCPDPALSPRQGASRGPTATWSLWQEAPRWQEGGRPLIGCPNSQET